MPSGNGLDIARTIKHEMPEIKVVIMSQNDAGPLLPVALGAGAVGCVVLVLARAAVTAEADNLDSLTSPKSFAVSRSLRERGQRFPSPLVENE
jgi:DNA-binding NarL/FixJ family response regulator